jgi:hypothetical protein
MGMTPEAKVKKALDKMLKAEGVFFFAPQAGIYGRSGIPDRIACIEGLFVGIECKAPDTKYKVTALQKKAIDDITASGGKCFVVWNDEMIDVVRQWIAGVKTKVRLGVAP